MVPLATSTGPLFSSCTGPTKLRLTVDGDGPKYERFTVAPTEGGAGNRLHPGPVPIGPGPGPCAVLGSPAAAASATLATLAIAPWNAPRGVRSRGESCANAVTPSVIAIAEAIVREIRRTLRSLQFIETLLYLKLG